VLAPERRRRRQGDTGDVLAVTPDGRSAGGRTQPTRPGASTAPLMIANDTVYVGAYDGNLYAFDLERRAVLARPPATPSGRARDTLDGIVYIAVEYYDPSGGMFGVDAVTGDVVWEDQRPTDHPHSTAAIDADHGWPSSARTTATSMPGPTPITSSSGRSRRTGPSRAPSPPSTAAPSSAPGTGTSTASPSTTARRSGRSRRTAW